MDNITRYKKIEDRQLFLKIICNELIKWSEGHIWIKPITITKNSLSINGLYYAEISIRFGSVNSYGDTEIEALINLCRVIFKNKKLPWINDDPILRDAIIESFKKYKYYSNINRNKKNFTPSIIRHPDICEAYVEETIKINSPTG